MDDKTNEPIGIVGIVDIDLETKSLGKKSSWGKDVGTEALQIAFKYAFKDWILIEVFLPYRKYSCSAVLSEKWAC